VITDQFKKDYRQLVAQGVEFTPEDIVRLNALSVKARLSRTAAHSVHLPRLAFMPRDSWWRAPIVLREPTIAHELWLEEAARWIDLAAGDNWTFLHCFALSRPASKLPDAFRPRKVIKAVFGFAAKRLSRFTQAQLSSAVAYALFGADWTACESAPAKADGGKAGDIAIPREPECVAIGLLTTARALRLPISLDEAKGMTASELEEAVNRAVELDGKFDQDRAHARAFGEYVRAREEIRNRRTPCQTTT
jgi:hypothetical protein